MHYPNAPITEAVFDLKTNVLSEKMIDTIKKVHPLIEKHYPEVVPLRESVLEFKLQPNQKPAEIRSDREAGCQFWSSDKQQVAQFKLDGFSFSRLKPYTSWDSISVEVKKLWEIYLKEIQPSELTRLSVRFINTIEIPHKKFSLEEYLTVAPRSPEGITYPTVGFLSQMKLYDEENGLRVMIKTNFSPSLHHETTRILLDIDVVKDVSMKPDASEEVWYIFNERLRKVKNEIFEKSLTSRAKELFK